MKIAENAVKGITTTLKESKMNMAAIQAAWRFYNNERVDVQELFENVKDESEEIIKNIDSSFLLVAHDWSWLDFKTHTSKEDLITRDKKGNAKQIGYDLHTSLIINPNNGNPLAPIARSNKQIKKFILHIAKIWM